MQQLYTVQNLYIQKQITSYIVSVQTINIYLNVTITLSYLIKCKNVGNQNS